jgi:hypothetical protein
MHLKNFKKTKYALFFAIMMLGALFLAGCSGDDGSTGAQGPQGPQGPPGPEGPPAEETLTDETCSVCHSAGKIADIAVYHPDPIGKDVTVSNISLKNVGGVPEVSFHAATSTGPVTDVTFDDVRFYIADLVPADTPTLTWGSWSSPYFERWGYESSSSSTPTGVFANNGSGDYTYSFVTGFGSAEALAEAPDYDPSHTQRLFIRVSGHNDASGNAITNNTVGTMDFTVPAIGDNAIAMVSQRMFVTVDACKKCHGSQMDNAAHATSYLDTRACVICHSPIGHYGDEMQADSAYLSVFIHKIHAAIDIPAFSGEINGLGFGAVTYPQEVKNCVVCHTTSGLNLGTGNQIDNWKNHPTAEICGSCHTDINFATGANHGGGVQNNSSCTVCHPASGTGFGKSVSTAHDTSPTGMNVPEFDVTISITDPANGAYYVAAEEPVVTVTLKNHGTATDPKVYTLAQDKPGHAGGGLSNANLYVYGPRAKSVPVLSTGTITDPSFDAKTSTPTQAHALFMGGTDSQVATNSAGFKYKLLKIPSDMEPGTYMVRFEGADYGGLSDTDYVTSSNGVINIQVGTGTVEKKVAGDSCINCHGDTRMHLTGSFSHNAPFDTDHCLACHDQSGNYAIPIANRVHAIHSANSAGDIYNIEGGSRDWSDVTYPRDIATCVACHTSGDITYKNLPYTMPCAGCHVGAPGVLDHMRQNGGPY